MSDDGDWSMITDYLTDGAEYEVQAAHTGYGGSTGVVGDWTDSETITTVADATAPDSPSGLGVTTGSGSALVSWFNPTSSNYYSCSLYRSAVNDFGTASLVEQLFGSPGAFTEHAESLAAGTYYWWVVASNRSGAQAAPVGPAAGTVT
jgi:hypothetical protein